MHIKYESFIREPLVEGNKDYHQVSEDIVAPIEGKPGRMWYVGFFFSIILLCFGIFSVSWSVYWGLGTWGVNRTIGWGWDITNFVWWIGIGHAGTLISAILLLFRQGWRTGVNRAAEAMTIFAVMCAGQFPIWHMGRVWDGFFVLPYPNTRGPLWPNFDSPLLWDVFAISTYFTVSLLFWYSGLIPDFALIRDRAKTKLRKMLYGVASFGWTGTAKNWQRQEALALVLAGLSTPLVLSVHTIVSFDFATSVIPGWHTTIFPPYFVAGAVFSGFAMVNTLLVLTRKILHLEEYITIGHLEAMNKIIVLTGSIVGVAYLTELFIAWYSQSWGEMAAFQWRILGPYWWSYWAMMTCNVVSPQLFWVKKLRRNVPFTFVMSIVVNIGMWFERFVIIVTSTYRDWIPGSWSYYSPQWTEVGFYLGTFGLFFTCYFLFAKYFPVIAISEIKFVLKTSGRNFKEKMNHIEEMSAESFYHIAEASHHDDTHGVDTHGTHDTHHKEEKTLVDSIMHPFNDEHLIEGAPVAEHLLSPIVETKMETIQEVSHEIKQEEVITVAPIVTPVEEIPVVEAKEGTTETNLVVETDDTKVEEIKESTDEVVVKETTVDGGAEDRDLPSNSPIVDNTLPTTDTEKKGDDIAD